MQAFDEEGYKRLMYRLERHFKNCQNFVYQRTQENDASGLSIIQSLHYWIAFKTILFETYFFLEELDSVNF